MRLAALLPLLAACASARPPAPPGPEAELLHCDPGAALPAALLAPGTALLFGEVHGTAELPALFGELVCAAAASGAPVTVGLELPRSEQARADAFLSSAGGPGDRAALLAGAHWTRAYQDGRSSEAMAALLERLRQLRAAGLAVEVVLFDVDDAGGDRDQRMAEAIAARVRARPAARLLALAGNYHVRTRPGAPWDAGVQWMGCHLRAAGIPTLGFDVGGEAGSAWVCRSPEARECGPAKVRPARPMPGAISRGAGLLPEETAEGHAGLWSAGALTASPPAVVGATR